jgi:hypothetical protein
MGINFVLFRDPSQLCFKERGSMQHGHQGIHTILLHRAVSQTGSLCLALALCLNLNSQLTAPMCLTTDGQKAARNGNGGPIIFKIVIDYQLVMKLLIFSKKAAIRKKRHLNPEILTYHSSLSTQDLYSLLTTHDLRLKNIYQR